MGAATSKSCTRPCRIPRSRMSTELLCITSSQECRFNIRGYSEDSNRPVEQSFYSHRRHFPNNVSSTRRITLDITGEEDPPSYIPPTKLPRNTKSGTSATL